MGKWLFLGALNGLIAVGAGAYGWHWLEVDDSGLRDIFAMGVDYQMWHALALLAVAWLSTRCEGRAARLVTVSGWSFTLGIVLFSGTLYYLGLTGEAPLHGLAPAGGLFLMAGWGALMGCAVVHARE